jgi:hypothetical protein
MGQGNNIGDTYGWMNKVKGGKRTSEYSEPKVEKVKKTRLQKFKEGAAEFKRRRIDSYAR